MSMPLMTSLPHPHKLTGVPPTPKHLATQTPHPHRSTHSTTHRHRGRQPCECTGASLTSRSPDPPHCHHLLLFPTTPNQCPSRLVSAGTTQTSSPPMRPPPHKAPTSPAPARRATTRWRQALQATRTPIHQPAITPHPRPWPIRYWSACMSLRVQG